MCIDCIVALDISTGEYVILLTKRRGALKLAVQKMVQKACVILEEAPDKETTLKLIDTLRTVSIILFPFFFFFLFPLKQTCFLVQKPSSRDDIIDL